MHLKRVVIVDHVLKFVLVVDDLWVFKLSHFGSNDVTVSTTSIMVFITKWPRLPWYIHEARTGELIHPFGHAFVDAIDPTQHEIGDHILIPHLKH